MERHKLLFFSILFIALGASMIFLSLTAFQTITKSSHLISSQAQLPNNQSANQNVLSTTSQASNSAQPSLLGQTYLVTRVVDGDTIVVNINGQDKTLRLIGVNTPETVDPRRPVQCFGHEASDETKSLLTGKGVTLEKDVSETDKFGRLLRYVYLPQPDGTAVFVNDYLVRTGFAQVDTFPPDVKYQQKFLEAQKEAKSKNLGLWSKC